MEKFNAHNIKKKRIRNSIKLNSRRSSSRKSINNNYNIMDLIQFPPKQNSIQSGEYLYKGNYIKKTRNIEQQKFSDINSKTEQKLSIKNNSETNNAMKKSEEKQINSKIPEDIKKNDNIEIYNFDNKEKEHIKQNKKTCFEIYWSILRKKHIILFTFFTRNDYNIIYIKFERFIFSVCTYMALNVFFFEDETMHKIHADYGKFNLLQQIPQIIYSSIVSQLIDIFVCYLILTEKYFYEIKKIKLDSRDKIIDIIKCIKIKIATFFIFTFLMFIFYWYTIACFCSVYENTQIIFIEDSISSFALGLLYPFILYIFLAVYKLMTLKKTEKI